MPERQGLMHPHPNIPPVELDRRRGPATVKIVGPGLPWLLGLLLLVAGGSGCKPDRLPGESPILSSDERMAAAEAALTEQRPVAWVGEEVVHVDDVDRWIFNSSLMTRTWFHEYASRQEALPMLVDTFLMAREGELLVPPDDPEIMLHVGLVAARSWLRRTMTDEPPSEEEVIAFVSQDPARWRIPPHREVTAFTFSDEESALAFRARLDRHIGRATHPWPVLLDQKLEEWTSTHPVAPGLHGHLGRVSPVSEHVPEAIRRAVFEGFEISTRAPLQVEDHWAVLWVGVDTPAVDPPDDVVLHRAGARIEADANAARARRELDSLRAALPIERNEALISRVSASRQQLAGDAERPTLPRLFSAERIADHPSATLGIEQYQAIEAERRSLGRLLPARAQLDQWEAERQAAAEASPGDGVDTSDELP